MMHGHNRRAAIHTGASTIIALGVLAFVNTPQAAAQRVRDPQYRPATPTLSPYIGLLQTNVGPVPNYFSMVRPRIEQRAFQRQVTDVTRTQSLQIQSLSRDANQRSTLPQTGKGAGFMQYLHYFPATQSAVRR